MSALEQVPAFRLNQDFQLEPPHQILSRAEARAMKRAGLGWFISHGRAFRLAERAPAPMIVDPLTSPAPAGTAIAGTAITETEMRANVGICEPGVRNPREAVRVAQAKVKLYPAIFEVLAPAARCYELLNPSVPSDVEVRTTSFGRTYTIVKQDSPRKD